MKPFFGQFLMYQTQLTEQKIYKMVPKFVQITHIANIMDTANANLDTF